MNLKFRYNFWLLKKNFNKFQKIKKKYNAKNIEKKKFINFFIKDEEDKILNKKVLDNFDKQLQKYKIEFYKREQKINKLLYSLDLIDLNFIEIFYKEKISVKNCSFIKILLENKIIKRK